MVITLDRQKRIREWAGNTVRRFSIIFSPSILGEIPVYLDDSLGLEWLPRGAYSHQNKDVRRLYTSVEFSLGYFF